MRRDGRKNDDIREVNIIPSFLSHPYGSCLIQMGGTRVICSMTYDESVPPFLRGTGQGWLSAEYSMLPGSTIVRSNRERMKISGRTQEIQRIIGRSLRTCLNLPLLGERTILIDCDVLDADGGTRTAAITGAYVALVLGLRKLRDVFGKIENLVKYAVAAISVGVVDTKLLLDLNYEEDSVAEVDMNIIKTSDNKYVELQGTAEESPFLRNELFCLLDLADKGIKELFEIQKKVLQ